MLLGTSDGAVYVGQANSIYRVAPGERPVPLLMDAPHHEALCEGADHSIWFALKTAMVRWKGKSQDRVRLPTQDAGSIESCAVDTNGTLWIHSERLGVLHFSGDRWVRTTVPVDDLGSRTMIADRRGRIISYARGALYFCSVDKDCSTINADPHLPISTIQTLYQGQSDLLAGGRDGIFRIRDRSIRFLSSDRVPVLRGVVGIVQSADGQTWLAASRGIVRISTAALERAFDDPNARLSPLILDAREGLRGTSIASGVHDAVQGGDGRLWFATSGGVVWVDPAHLHRNLLAPKVAIGTLIAGGRTYRDPVRISLPVGTASGEIDFAVLSFVIPQRTQVRYRLDGSDTEWIDPGPRRQMFFSNLGPGTYRFRVIAANNDGVWNRTGATLEIVIPPTFVQSIWFKLLCLVLFAAALWLAYSLRVRRLTSRLQSTLEVRLAERERIARELHDTLLQGFQGLILRIQAVADRMPAPSPWRDTLYEELDLADGVLIEGRNRVGEVRATASTEELAQSLLEMAPELRADTTMRFELTVEGRSRPLHPLVREEVERIGHEAIRNAIHHSRGTLVSIDLAYHRRKFRLAVRDNGVGLPQTVGAAGGRAGHFGMPGMRERAQRIGGTLIIQSRRDGGTQVLLSVPGSAAYRSSQPRWRWLFPAPSVGGDDV
jgi:signal transduction histidine kinase